MQREPIKMAEVIGSGMIVVGYAIKDAINDGCGFMVSRPHPTDEMMDNTVPVFAVVVDGKLVTASEAANVGQQWSAILEHAKNLVKIVEEVEAESISYLTGIIQNWANSVIPERQVPQAFLKLYGEIGEVIDNPKDPLEYADVAILLFDLAAMHNIDLAAAIRDKVEILKKRSWEQSPVGTFRRRLPVDLSSFEHSNAYKAGKADFKAGEQPDQAWIEGSPEFREAYMLGYLNGVGEDDE